MAQHSEKDYIIPAVRVIHDHGQCTMETIKNEIDKYIVLSDEDKIPYDSRSASEPRYRQIVGNMKSHNSFLNYVIVDTPASEVGKKSPKYLYSLNIKGQNLFQNDENEEFKRLVYDMLDDAEEEQEIENADSVDDETLALLDNRDVDLTPRNNSSKRPKTDPRIAKSVMEKNNYMCKYGSLTNTRHITFDAKRGNKYVEAHHLIPLSASNDFYPINLDRSNNIVPLCPLCHAQVHHGTLVEKVKVLEVLYDDYIEKLNGDSIDISFDDLVNKYYK